MSEISEVMKYSQKEAKYEDNSWRELKALARNSAPQGDTGQE